MRERRPITLSRRTFLSVVVSVPAGSLAIACGTESSDPARSGPRGADATGAVPDAAGSTLDGATANDAPDDRADAGPPECDAKLPRIDLKADCGAIGDGVADDTSALQKAARLLQAAGGGQLTIPPGVYVVGRQTPRTARDAGASGPYWVTEDFFRVTGLSCLTILGRGAVLRVAPSIRFGGFDAVTGAAKDVTTRNQDEAAHVGHVIELSSCGDVYIEGLEIDGNLGALVLGGQWGDVDRQTSATGIWMNKCERVTIVDVHSHHHGLDGITVLYTGGPPDKKRPHTLTRVVAEYNGRQGLSWIGGWGLECIDCKFNHTGRAINEGGGRDSGAPLASKPMAGVDIEPNAGTTERSRDGVFTRCEFVDNRGAGMVAAVGDGGYSTFTDCTFWGTTSYAIWAHRPGLRFVSCTFHGTCVHVSDGHTDADATPNPTLATSFEGCTFEDLPFTDGRVFRSANLYTVNDGGGGARWKNCTFTNHEVRSVFIGDPTTREIFDTCNFVFANATLSNTSQASFAGSQLTSCHFGETPAVTASGHKTYVNLDSVIVAAGSTPTTVDGPGVHWQSTSGSTGAIAPGTYSS